MQDHVTHPVTRIAAGHAPSCQHRYKNVCSILSLLQEGEIVAQSVNGLVERLFVLIINYLRLLNERQHVKTNENRRGQVPTIGSNKHLSYF